MPKLVALLLLAVLSCKSSPTPKSNEPPATAAPASALSPANPPATQVTGAQPKIPETAGQPATPPGPAAQQQASAERTTPQAPPPGIDLTALDRSGKPC